MSWSYVRWALVAPVLAALVGCSAPGLQNGIGTSLAPSDAAYQSQIQEAYAGIICRREGLPFLPDGTCDVGHMNPAFWTIFVQSGMNDIDTRCDAYLAWLDRKTRAQPVILKEISNIRDASQAILTATGADKSMQIVGFALGFATNTFTNVNSLLLSVDGSTVQKVVYNSRSTFRRELQPRAIDSKPTAIYALRSYLEICTPMTIATNINIGAGAIGTGTAATSVVAADTFTTVYVVTPYSNALRAYFRQSSANQKAMANWLVQHQFKIDAVTFAISNYPVQQSQMMKDLGIPAN